MFTFANSRKHYRFTLVQDLCEEHGFNSCTCNNNYFNPNVNETPFHLYKYNRLQKKCRYIKYGFLKVIICL